MKQITGEERNDFLFRKTGSLGAMMTFENTVYSRASSWDKNYSGGFWKFYEVEGHDEETSLDVSAWFMAFDTDEEMTAATCYDFLNTDAMTWSVALNLVLFSQLSFHFDEKGDSKSTQVFASAFHSLKNAAFCKLIPNLDLQKLAQIID